MLVSEKLSLRPIELSDSHLLQSLVNDPMTSANVVGWSFPVSLHNQQDWIKSLNSQSSYRLVITNNSTQEAIGLTGLWNIDWHNQSAESGIKILPNQTQNGFGKEALLLTTAWAFYVVGLRRLYAEILDFNSASWKLYVKKCGWRVEGCQKEAIFRKGEWHDLYNLAILKREFDQQEQVQKFIELVCPIETIPFGLK